MNKNDIGLLASGCPLLGFFMSTSNFQLNVVGVLVCLAQPFFKIQAFNGAFSRCFFVSYSKVHEICCLLFQVTAPVRKKSAAHSRAQSKNAAHKVLALTLARVRFWRASSRVHQMVTHAGRLEQLEMKKKMKSEEL